MKKAIVIYDTKFGNTEKVARALALGMEKEGIMIDCAKLDKIEIGRLAEYDLLAIGGPTHAFGASKPMKNFLKKLKGINLEHKNAFAFDTKNKYRWAGSAGKNIEIRCKKLGMRIVKPHVSAIVKGMEGPLEEGTEEMFERIGAEIVESIR